MMARARTIRTRRAIALLCLLGSLPGSKNCAAQALATSEESSPRKASAEIARADSGEAAMILQKEKRKERMNLVTRFAEDQRRLWTSPERVRFSDAEWLIPTGGFVAVGDEQRRGKSSGGDQPFGVGKANAFRAGPQTALVFRESRDEIHSLLSFFFLQDHGGFSGIRSCAFRRSLSGRRFFASRERLRRAILASRQASQQAEERDGPSSSNCACSGHHALGNRHGRSQRGGLRYLRDGYHVFPGRAADGGLFGNHDDVPRSERGRENSSRPQPAAAAADRTV